MHQWLKVTDSPFGGWTCSRCHYYNFDGRRTPFCPYCGSKMKNPDDGGLSASVNLFREIRKTSKAPNEKNRSV